MRTSLPRAILLGVTRRSWIVGAVTVTVCATLAAQAAGNVVEARYLSDATHAPAVTRVAPVAAPAPAPIPTAPATASLVERNMFCSDCVAAGDPDPAAGAGALRSSLPLVLIATSLGTDPWATVRNTESGAQGAFGVGDRIPRVGAIAAIAGTWIEVANDAAEGRIERIELLTVAAPGPTAGGGKPVATAEKPPESPFADRVNKIDDHTYEVDRQLVRELATSAGGQVKGVRVTPVIKDDKLAGLKVLVAKPDSVAAAVGLRPGDVIQTIDGKPIESAQQMIDIMARLDEISSVQFDGTRRGKKEPLALELRLR
jgi:type II secretion system protein C